MCVGRTEVIVLTYERVLWRFGLFLGPPSQPSMTLRTERLMPHHTQRAERKQEKLEEQHHVRTIIMASGPTSFHTSTQELDQFQNN